MNPSDFDGSNRVFTKPAGWTEEQCQPLRVFDTGEDFISCWKLTPEEMEQVKETGEVWLRVSGRGHPPVSLEVRSPIILTNGKPARAIPFDKPQSDLEWLRDNKWSVAIHNDYQLNGQRYTFWLFTHPRGRWAKGEGTSDKAALAECRQAADAWNNLDGEVEDIMPPAKPACTADDHAAVLKSGQILCPACGGRLAIKLPINLGPAQYKCATCSDTGKRPVYSAGEEMVAGFKPCPDCQPCPDGDACPDARKYGSVHPDPTPIYMNEQWGNRTDIGTGVCACGKVRFAPGRVFLQTPDDIHTRSRCYKPEPGLPVPPTRPPTRPPPAPTHRCKVCGALWRLNPAEPTKYPPDHPFHKDTWSLYHGERCGKCCDNEAMGEQIAKLGKLNLNCRIHTIAPDYHCQECWPNAAEDLACCRKCGMYLTGRDLCPRCGTKRGML